MRLSDWLYFHPNSEILQPDSNFQEKYDSLRGYDAGLLKNGLELRDSSSWQRKSWVVGVDIGNQSRAYDWNELVSSRWLEDTLASTAILITMESNHTTHYAMMRELEGKVLHFDTDSSGQQLEDRETRSLWLPNGKAVSGPMSGKQLPRIQSYQEYWHSWKQFRPASSQFGKK